MFRAIIIGNLGSDAHVESNNGRPFVSFNVGHNDRYTDAEGQVKETTQWISCALNGDGGKLLPYLKKGKAVYVEGRASTKVFSSEKLRRMVAGVNISVDHLELLPGSPETMPRQVATSEGLLHNVNKAYYLSETEAKAIVGKGKEATVYSPSGQPITLLKNGILLPQEPTPAKPEQTEANSNEDEVF